MRLWRLSIRSETERSGGFEWHVRRSEARRRVEDLKRANGKDDESTIEPIDFRCSRAGVLALLRRVADHPDNG